MGRPCERKKLKNIQGYFEEVPASDNIILRCGHASLARQSLDTQYTLSRKYRNIMSNILKVKIMLEREILNECIFYRYADK
jgi:hypothetical protein